MRVTREEKRKFFHLFLEKVDRKRWEIIELIHYLMDKPHLLDKVIFVEHAHLTPRGCNISITKNEELTFRFYKDHVSTKDVTKAFHDIRLNKREHLYLELYFDGLKGNIAYYGVLEENPYAPNLILSSTQKQAVADVLNKSLLKGKLKRLKMSIDKSLDEGDVETFNKLTKELHEILQFEKQSSR